jgi:hypothetical protein
MPKALRYLFLIHAIVAVILGALLLIAPGRFLGWMGWAPVDPILSRVLGAALLAIAWSSFRGWQATARAQVTILIEMEVAFTVLACLGLLRHLLFAHYPLMVWALFAGFAIFAVAWIVSLLKK